MAILSQLVKFVPFPVSLTSTRFKPLRYLANIGTHSRQTGTREFRGQAIEFDFHSSREQFLFFYFFNLIRYFQRSDLGVFIKQQLQPGDHFVDIGANYGFYSLLALQQGAQVTLVEPEPEALTFLNANSELFHQIFNVGLSDFEGNATFFVSELALLGASSLKSGGQSLKQEGYTRSDQVQVKRFDTLAQENPSLFNQIALIKIDCEGSEESVVKGMVEFLAQNSRVKVWCEVRGPTSTRAPDSYKAVIDLFRDLGFRPFIYKKGHFEPFEGQGVRQVFDLLFSKSNP